ncbi:MAG: PQQ-binding-like beta-propeller repeat protein [Kiritimatiellaeota bacterium]|nr:PQQ-binding-like beta-propeller repeat protein [Kiritimatiellota bacterium]
MRVHPHTVFCPGARTVCRAFVLVCLAGVLSVAAAPSPAETARGILEATGVHGGVVVHLGCGDGRLTAALRADETFLVQGLDPTPENVRRARDTIMELGLYGPVTAGRLSGRVLPYIDNMVNLIVATDGGAVPEGEMLRVLAPGGVAYIREKDAWRKVVKPRPKNIDEWTHYLHDPGNNAVAHDTVVGPPRHLQWRAGPKWSRHHDHVSSTTALVSAGNRVFQIIDLGSLASILLPSHWALVCRDAFNGKLLWERSIPAWETRMWSLKSGPAQLPRHLVAVGDEVYATLGLNVPVSVLDAADGRTLRTYPGTKGAEEILCSKGDLFVLADPQFDMAKYTDPRAVRRPWWDGRSLDIVGLRADSGRELWRVSSPVLPLTLAVDDRGVYFHDGDSVVCLDRRTGRRLWRSKPVPRCRRIMSFFAPTLVVRQGVVLFAGGEESGLVKSTGGATKSDTLTGLDARTGAVLWTAPHPPSGYSSPENVFVIGNTVWFDESSNGGLAGTVTGRDIRSGNLVSQFKPDVVSYWFHHRCYRGRATDRFLLTSRTGIEFIDLKRKHWTLNHWIRGSCSYGIMPCNGLIYTPPHPCICYAESKLSGFDATAPSRSTDGIVYGVRGDRFEKGTAIRPASTGSEPGASGPGAEWATYRHDSTRSGATSAAPPARLVEKWTTRLHGRLTAPTLAAGRLYVAETDRHTLYALDMDSGRILWRFTAGGRIDSPPTVTGGRVLFGCRDGAVYCLDARDGRLNWRFRAAPSNVQLVAAEQLESVWPIHGSVLVMRDTVWLVAGRSMFLDGGLRWLELDARTGRVVRELVLGNLDPATGKDLHTDVKWLNMPVALPDVLSSDGAFIYMRSQRFDLTGRRYDLVPKSDRPGVVAADQSGPGRHLFSPTGFLDDTWFQRSYWIYGRKFSSGWSGYYLSGKLVPAGRILCFDKDTVYGYGRKPQFYRWTTPMEYQLFSAPLAAGSSPRKPPISAKVSCVRIENSPSLDSAGRPLTVAAWVKPERGEGVVVARGAAINGYSLYLRGGRPRFAVTVSHKVFEAAAVRKLPSGIWSHLCGVLARDGRLRVYVDGRLAGEKTGVPLISKTPIEPTQIGLDDGGPAGKYQTMRGFKGAIDQVRVYRRALAGAEIEALVQAPGATRPEEVDLVLFLPFDGGRARDESGKGNHGRIENAKVVGGKVGRALAFAGAAPTGPETTPGYSVPHRWTADVPILVRGMVLTAAGTPEARLFIAGPADLMDETRAVRRLFAPAGLKEVAQQEAALAGRSGGVLWAVAAGSGAKLGELRLASPPVWDGLIAAGKRLYLSSMDGGVRCLGGP